VSVSALFSYIEELQGETPWGRVLDAGTGWSSLQWLTQLSTESLTAVTACPVRAAALSCSYRGGLREQDAVVTGNWVDEELLRGQTFDVVLVDYLLGAVDRFAPYFQSRLLDRLRRHVGGTMYLIGLEPYGDAEESVQAQLVSRIANLRDAALLLAQDRPHREYPRWWVSEELPRRGFEILSTRSFPIAYGESFVVAELDVCLEALEKLPEGLRAALAAEEKSLRWEALQQIRRHGPLRCGFDYVISARPARR
jgi:hypothetical protein